MDKAGNNDSKVWWANLWEWLDLPLLCLLYLVIAVPMLLFSSVTVANDTPEVLTATLAPAQQVHDDKPGAQGGNPSDRTFKDSGQRILLSWVPTSPFGETYLLTVDGYLPQMIKIFPLTGVTISPRRDLLPSLSVLFRPDADGLRTLADGGRLEVWSEAGGKRTPVATSMPRSPVSILVGNDPPISPTLVENWRLELMAKELKPDMIAKRLQQWKAPDRPQSGIPLQPGMILGAELKTRDAVVMARTHVTLGMERLTDIMLDSNCPYSNSS